MFTTLLLWSVVTAAPTEIRVRGADVADGLNQSLQGLEIHLDYDVPGKDGKLVARSYVKLPEALGGERSFFSMPTQPVDLGGFGTVRYGIHDVNLKSVNLGLEDDHYLLTLLFEDQGYELVAMRNGAGGLAGLVPDLQMDHLKVTVAFTPKQGTAQIERGHVTFDADIRPGGDAMAIDPATLAPFTAVLKKEIEKEANQKLASKEVLGALNAKLASDLKAQAKAQGGSVNDAHFDGTDVILRVGSKK